MEVSVGTSELDRGDQHVWNGVRGVPCQICCINFGTAECYSVFPGGCYYCDYT